jgi:hypothetical protein
MNSPHPTFGRGYRSSGRRPRAVQPPRTRPEKCPDRAHHGDVPLVRGLFQLLSERSIFVSDGRHALRLRQCEPRDVTQPTCLECGFGVACFFGQPGDLFGNLGQFLDVRPPSCCEEAA